MRIQNTIYLLVGIIAILCVLACENASQNSDNEKPVLKKESTKQPLEFDHKAHIDAEELACIDCHKFAKKGPYATLPKLKDCKDCHSEAQGKHPDEPKVREYIDKELEIPWVTFNRVNGHVYFSHQAHVNFGKMKCQECHVDMSKVSKTISGSDIKHLTMQTCMECHKQKNAANECATCHK